MVIRRDIIIILCFHFITLIIFAQKHTAVLKIPYYNKSITVDGAIEDWNKYVSYSFSDTLHKLKTIPGKDYKDLVPRSFDLSLVKKPLSKNRVEFRTFWNNENLNFVFIVHDEHLFAEIPSELDTPRVHLNDGVEVYIDTKNNSGLKMNSDDYQFLVDIKNNREVFRGDRRLIAIDSIAVSKDYEQNVLFKSAVKTVGSINYQGDPDSLFIVEISIPFIAIGLEPAENMRLRIDACVNDIDYPASETVIEEYLSSSYWSFNWSGYSDFGYPEYWKTAQLTGSPSWIEIISERYKSSWAVIFFITFTLTVVILSWLLYLNIKLRKLPTRSEIEEKKILLIYDKPSDAKSMNEKILYKASEFIVNKKSEHLNSEEVAKGIGISLRNFQRITKAEINLTPTNYIYAIKLKLAADYLSNKSGNVTDAAYEFGFSDPSYFSKIFKNHFGKSPSEYLNRT